MDGNNYPDKNDRIKDGEIWVKKSESDKKVKKIVVACVILALVVAAGINFFLLRFNVVLYGDKISLSFGKNSDSTRAIDEKSEGVDSAYDEFEKKMRTIYSRIHGVYDGDIEDDKLFDGAYKGMVESLGDPYSVYMNEEDYKISQEGIRGSYVGIGISVGVVEEGVVVVSPFKDSPAEKAGLLPGDIIAEVNGIEIGKDLDKAVSMMRGEEGGLVKLKIQRKEKEIIDVEVKRAEIKRDTVYSEMIDNEIGYIGIAMFGETTDEEFESNLDSVMKSGAKGLIIDLRGNPGGLVDTCIDITSKFVPKGKLITYTIDKTGSEYKYESKGGNIGDIPVVVLINEGSASASEIFSGALRDYERATLIGEKSFGKGIVQTMLYRSIDGFGDGTALKLTFSRYYTPNGENIHKKGIKPNIEVKLSEDYVRGERETDNQFQKAVEVIKEKVLESK